MPFATVMIPTLPRPTQARLYYGHQFAGGAERFDYLHLIRSRSFFSLPNPKEREEAYWSNLETNRWAFVDGLGEQFDLIVDPPSRSGYHRPYLSAFLSRQPDVRCVRFMKSEPVKSAPVNMPRLREVVSTVEKSDLSEFRNVLLVDDVFSTATIAAVGLEKLREAGLSQQAQITVACPLWLVMEVAQQAADYIKY